MLLLVPWLATAYAQQNAASLATAASKGDKAALALLTTLARKGHSSAQFNLGSMYDFGDGVLKDPVQAIEWYRKAAEQGDADAQFSLGRMFRYGRGIPKDSVQAVGWYRKAAEQGNANAQGALGLMYIQDDGLPKDFIAAHMWNSLAAAQGVDVAKTLRDALEKEMTPAQIAEAQKMSREWKRKK